jgi:hypothetical protein
MTDLEKMTAYTIFYILGYGFAIAGLFRIATHGVVVGIFGILIGIATIVFCLKKSDRLHKKHKDNNWGQP